jgi:N-acetylmuramic acid 6-phosphate etherase
MPGTETINPRYRGLDTWEDEAVLSAFVEGQQRAVAAVGAAKGAISRAARASVDRLGDTGRLIYVGAGSSGLIGALDGIELAGTFGWPESRIAFVLASGTLLKPGLAGGPEDNPSQGEAEIAKLKPQHSDTIIAIAASGSTPYTLAAARSARRSGALTIAIANNPDAPLLRDCEIPILLDSGPEVITGSTRMGAGTAQKAALGLLSSLIMIRLGHVHDGHMVGLRADNAKLRKRAVAMLADIAGVDEPAAQDALDLSGGHVKRAVLVARGIAPAEADRILANHRGNLRAALAGLR